MQAPEKTPKRKISFNVLCDSTIVSILPPCMQSYIAIVHVGGLVQERRKFIANPLELHLSYTNPWIYKTGLFLTVSLQDFRLWHQSN